MCKFILVGERKNNQVKKNTKRGNFKELIRIKMLNLIFNVINLALIPEKLVIVNSENYMKCMPEINQVLCIRMTHYEHSL